MAKNVSHNSLLFFDDTMSYYNQNEKYVKKSSKCVPGDHPSS